MALDDQNVLKRASILASETGRSEGSEGSEGLLQKLQGVKSMLHAMLLNAICTMNFPK